VTARKDGVSLKKNVQTQMNKAFDNNLGAVMERVGDDSEDASEAESESDEELELKKKQSKPISERKIIKPKRKVNQSPVKS
jgi:hypothetical protein